MPLFRAIGGTENLDISGFKCSIFLEFFAEDAIGKRNRNRDWTCTPLKRRFNKLCGLSRRMN